MNENLEGKCIIVSAPSGAGKTTIVKALLRDLPMLSFSISACSREPRSTEVDGKDYYFVGVEGFKTMIAEQAFIEWEEVYENNFYGTLKEEINRIWSNKQVVVFDVDVIGGLRLKEIFSNQALSIFIQPPSIQELENRLRSRNTETEEKINMRVNKAKIELSKSTEFDITIVNEELTLAISEAKEQVLKFIEK